ncbi:MAG: hypothetical protein NTY86_02520 [Deltaproteobacteria bacterium]|nr:hypothetical protein [Deltaproteobacteria bacterium]
MTKDRAQNNGEMMLHRVPIISPPEVRQERRRRAGDRREPTIDFWTIAIAILLLIMGYCLGYTWHAYQVTPLPHRDIHAAAQIPEAEKRWIEQRHKYHGIYAHVEENGEHYFYRDGKKCKL